jgi:hypothetical protein
MHYHISINDRPIQVLGLETDIRSQAIFTTYELSGTNEALLKQLLVAQDKRHEIKITDFMRNHDDNPLAMVRPVAAIVESIKWQDGGRLTVKVRQSLKMGE